jgi:hypothetical protein
LQIYGSYLLYTGIQGAAVYAFTTTGAVTLSGAYGAAVNAINGSFLSPTNLINYATSAYNYVVNGELVTAITQGYQAVAAWVTGATTATTTAAAVSPYASASASFTAANGSAAAASGYTVAADGTIIYTSTASSGAGFTFAQAVPYIAIILAIDAMTGGHIMHSVSNTLDDIGNSISNAGSDFDDFVHDLFSDIRTKEKIEFITQIKTGLNLYSFEYKPQFKNHPLGGHARYIGYMAHEVEKLYPNAVQVQPNGYKSVNYSLIGI